MVALAQWIELQAPDVVAENRVWDFLGEPPNRVRQTPVQVADCDREKALIDYDSCRGPSLAQRGDWSGGPHGDPDWTLEDYQELAADFGLTGFEGFPEDSQLYLGKTLYDLIVFEAQTGRDMSETLESWIESRPGLVLSEENKHMLAVSLGVGAMMPSGRGGLQKIDTKYLDKQGINAHALKKEVLGRRIKGGHYDFYQDKATGRVYLLRRGGRGKPIDTEINIRGGAGG